MQDTNGMMGGGTLPSLDIQPRVYLRKMGGGYVEITDIGHFERIEDVSENGKIEFGMAAEQSEAVKKILINTTDKYVDVKMEFEFGLVMTFSGFIEEVTSNTLTLDVSTEVSTSVKEMPQNLH